MFDYLVVGAGFAGSVIAERLASQLNKKVLVVDKRSHIAGNAYDCFDDNGVLIHRYGPHIFHTNSKMVIDYLSKFTEWRLYEHRVLASVDGQLLPMPINRNTLNGFYGLNMSTLEATEFLEKIKIPFERIENSRDIIQSKVGQELYDKFFRGYTKKQWDLLPEELDASVCARIPIRTNCDDRYFSDKYQMMPLLGYTRMFEKILSHPNISILLQTDYREVINSMKFDRMIYTGPVDSFFDFVYGALPYRSLNFEFEYHEESTYQSVGTVNYPNSFDFTRITEFKYLTGQKHSGTTIVKEYPTEEGEPYYPIPRPANNELYQKYKKETEHLSAVMFIGRLGTYKYYNMDQVVAQALTTFEGLTK